MMHQFRYRDRWNSLSTRVEIWLSFMPMIFYIIRLKITKVMTARLRPLKSQKSFYRKHWENNWTKRMGFLLKRERIKGSVSHYLLNYIVLKRQLATFYTIIQQPDQQLHHPLKHQHS